MLANYAEAPLDSLMTFDLMEHVHKSLGFRVRLDNLAHATLKRAKTGTGLEAIDLWNDGEIEKLIEYCTTDVEITRELFIAGCRSGKLFYTDRDNGRCIIHTEYWDRAVKTLLTEGRR